MDDTFYMKQALLEAQKAAEEGRIGTDDAQLVEWYSDVPVKVVVGDSSNIKITLPQDLT